MKKLIHQLEQHLRETLGIPVVAHPWAESSGLPQYSASATVSLRWMCWEPIVY